MPERFQDEAELIGGTRTRIDVVQPSSGIEMSEKENEGLTAFVLKGIAQSQSAIQDEVKKTTDTMHEISLTLKEVSVRIEPLGLLQTSVNAHEGRITRVEQNQENFEKEHERNFRIILMVLSAITSVISGLLIYILTHAKFG